MSALVEWGSKIYRSAIAIENVPSGPWRGSMESKTADRIAREYAAGTGSSNFLYQPLTGTFKRRGGQTIAFDVFASQVGLLPALWLGDSKARQLEEFLSESVTDGVPTVSALVSKEAVASGLDDGWFAQLWWRDQAASVNRTIGSEYDATTYPAVGSEQPYRVIPLWYESGDGGLTRGTTEFLRRFFLSGSRRFLKVGNWWYFPSVKGTPCRWNGLKATVGVTALQASSDITTPPGTDPDWYVDGASTYWQALQTDDGATSQVGFQQNSVGSQDFIVGLNGTINPAVASWTVTLIARRIGTIGTYLGNSTMGISIVLTRSDGQSSDAVVFSDLRAMSTDWTTYTFTVNSWGGATGAPANSLRFNGSTATNPGAAVINITYASVAQGGIASIPCRLIPSGPLPPTHAGVIVAGSIIEGAEATGATMYPDADDTDAAWTNELGSATNIYQSIDDVAPFDSTNYIQCDTASNTCKVRMSDFAFVPANDSTVKIVFAAARAVGTTSGSVTLKLVQAGIDMATTGAVLVGLSSNQYTYDLTSAQIAAITAGAGGWGALILHITSGGGTTAGFPVRVTYANVTYAPSGAAAEGSWRGHDRFLYSVAYRFEDGSVWMPCTPRQPSATQPNGFNMFTLNSNSPDAQYDFITWTNVPIGPHGVVGRLLLRTPKVDSTIEGDELKLNPFDMRVVWELTDNSTTTYVDYQADDFGLAEDAAGLYVRYDHLMPPRARYIAGGDMRVIHAYGGRNPCAITIAPVGRLTDYDLNLLDSDSTAYSANGSYMRYRIETDGNATLRLVQGDGATASDTLTIDMDDYPTLQKLVDRINATSGSVNAQQWRAQLCPGANPEAPSKTALTPHIREIASVVSTSAAATLTKATGGLSVVPVGALISKTNVTVGTYVIRIDSDTQLTMSANATGTSTDTASFHVSLGDTAITGELGWQRVISNSLPGFIYFNESYLDDDPIDKSSVWMTTASPGSMRSAANNFSGKNANRFLPPVNAGISMGGAAVQQGFVLPFADKVFALKNTRDASTGIDEDYKLVELNATRGCIAWNTVTPGPGFVPYLTPDGLCAADLEREWLISEDLFDAPATGGLAYEIPLCVAAAAKDDDTAYASARIMRTAIWLNYRASGSHPSRQVKLDFSAGRESSGLEALLRAEPLVDAQTGRVVAPAGSLLGWSTPLVRALTAMCEGRRSDGAHLYGWNDSNAGSTGDGRIDEFETGDTDNGTAISAEVRFPWERLGRHTKLAAQEIVLEHAAPAGATVLLDYHRSYSDAISTLTPATTALVVGREIKLLPQAARVVTAACFIGYRQTAGGAAELRAFTLRVKSVPSYT